MSVKSHRRVGVLLFVSLSPLATSVSASAANIPDSANPPNSNTANTASASSTPLTPSTPITPSNTPNMPAASSTSNATSPDQGVTLYGTLDIGVAYQSAGGAESAFYPTGIYASVQKFDHQSQWVLNGNNWSQSKLGLRGSEPLGDGLKAVFQLELVFNPFSGELTDSLKALTINNGIAANHQTSAGDSSVAGQWFGGAAWLGLEQAHLGRLSFGRQKSLIAVGVDAYDPLYASQGFSPIGGPGTAAGGGGSQNRRLDGSIKYELQHPLGEQYLHVAYQYQPKSGAKPGTSQELAVGLARGGLVVDAFYANINAAIAAASLSASALSNVTHVCAGANVVNTACVPSTTALAGTISDNTAGALMARFTSPDKTNSVSAGVERIHYHNPSHPLLAGQVILGGYQLATVNNAAFPATKQLDVYWLGNQHAINARNDIYVAAYATPRLPMRPALPP